MLKPSYNNSLFLTIYTERNIGELNPYLNSPRAKKNCSESKFKGPRLNEPMMSINDKRVFKHYFHQAKILAKKQGEKMVYVEWGSGGSTGYAIEHATMVLSVENNPQWCQQLLKNIRIQCAIATGQLAYSCVDGGPVIEFGNPKNKTTYKSSYYTDILNNFESSKISPHFILIDGRYRVYVALNILKSIGNDAIIMIHDYKKRQFYQEVEKYYDKFIDVQSDSVFGVFKRKRTIDQAELKLDLLKYKFIVQ